MKKKMNLKQLKVKSFVTEVKKKNSDTVKGGITMYPCDFTPACDQH